MARGRGPIWIDDDARSLVARSVRAARSAFERANAGAEHNAARALEDEDRYRLDVDARITQLEGRQAERV